MTFTPDGNHVVSFAGDTPITFWKASTGTELRVLEGTEEVDVAFSPDSTRLAAQSHGILRLLDAETGIEFLRLRGHDGERVHTVAFSSDGTRVASGGHDQTVHIWDIVPYRIRYTERKAALATRDGNLTEAEGFYREALTGLRRVLGDDHRGTLASLRGLVGNLIAQGKFAEAEPLALERYERNEAAYGQTHINTVNALRLLINLYERWGKPAKAAEYRAMLPIPTGSRPGWTSVDLADLKVPPARDGPSRTGGLAHLGHNLNRFRPIHFGVHLRHGR